MRFTQISMAVSLATVFTAFEFGDASLMAESLINQFFTNPDGTKQKDGFFLEMGAVDGVEGSNSIQFEEHLGWDGILIEANPRSCKKLFKQERRKRAIKLCSSCCDNPSGYLDFELTNDPNVGAAVEVMTADWRDQWHLKRDNQKTAQTEIVKVPCAPLGRLLRSSGVVKIDMFSLDVELAEVIVLGGFDWTIPVRVFIIEVEESNSPAIAAMLTSHGYKLSEFEKGREWGVHGADQLWVHKNFDKEDWHGGAEWQQYKPSKEFREENFWSSTVGSALIAVALLKIAVGLFVLKCGGLGAAKRCLLGTKNTSSSV